MNRILTKDIALHLGKVIEIAGWIHRERDLGGVAFVPQIIKKKLIFGL